MNTVNLVGRLGNDPEEKNGVVKFSIATNDGTKDKPKTNWHNIVAFGKTGEVLSKFLSKGDMVGISGRLDYHKHEEKTYTSIIVLSFTFVGNKSDGSNQPKQQVPLEEDDLPF